MQKINIKWKSTLTKTSKKELKDFQTTMLKEVHDMIATQIQLLSLDMKKVTQSSITSILYPSHITTTPPTDRMIITQPKHNNNTTTQEQVNLNKCNTVLPAKE